MTRTQALLTEIARKGSTQASIAEVYRAGIVSYVYGNPECVDWPSVNQALLTRYKRSGLETVKRLAWKGVLLPKAEGR